MSTGKCSLCIAMSLYPLAVTSIICDIVMFFPPGKDYYAPNIHIAEEAKYMGGLVGGGIMVLVPAIYIHLTEKCGCCGHRCRMCVSIVFAAVGTAGALYSFFVAVLGLHKRVHCKTTSDSVINVWNGMRQCTQPEDVMQFYIGLFATVLVMSILQLILCGTQMINGLIGCLCGTSTNQGPQPCPSGRVTYSTVVMTQVTSGLLQQGHPV